MVKSLLAFALSGLIILQSFEKVSIVIYYQAYKDYIAKNLCENRYTPGSTCNGQCYLMKKLQKAEKRHQTPAAPDNQKSEFIVLIPIYCLSNATATETKHRQRYKPLRDREYLKTVFHPPATIA